MTKKQHFIQRAAYLRNFSNTKCSDDRKNALRFLDMQSLRSGMSNVYDLGCENCLYEDSKLDFNAVENFLSEIEADITPELSAIINRCSQSYSDNSCILQEENEVENLKFFLTLQFFRTPRMRDSYDCEEKDRSSVFLGALIGRTEQGTWWIQHNIQALSTLFFVFERNESSVPFVVPDHPVTIMKATEDETAFNFRFPLTPFLQVFLIDPRSADAITNNQYRNKVRRITPDHFQIVDSWNWLSLSEAKRFVYYPPYYMCHATPRGAVFRHR